MVVAAGGNQSMAWHERLHSDGDWVSAIAICLAFCCLVARSSYFLRNSDVYHLISLTQALSFNLPSRDFSFSSTHHLPASFFSLFHPLFHLLLLPHPTKYISPPPSLHKNPHTEPSLPLISTNHPQSPISSVLSIPTCVTSYTPQTPPSFSLHIQPLFLSAIDRRPGLVSFLHDVSEKEISIAVVVAQIKRGR